MIIVPFPSSSRKEMILVLACYWDKSGDRKFEILRSRCCWRKGNQDRQHSDGGGSTSPRAEFLVGKVPIGLTYIRFEMTADLERGSHSLRTLISSRMLKLFPPAFLRFHELPLSLSSPGICVHTHTYTHDNRRAIQLSSLCSFPGSTSTSDDIGGRKESSTDRTCPPWSFYCSLNYCSYSGLVDVESDVDSIYYYYCRCYFFGRGKRRNIFFTIVDRPCFDEI